MKISISSIHRILAFRGYTYKKLSKLSRFQSQIEIRRFTTEVNSICFSPSMLVFLDEASFNCSCEKQYGWSPVGEEGYYPSKYKRGKSWSALIAINVKGIVESFLMDKFDRLTFFVCLLEMLRDGKLNPYPGKNSILIMDGATIHRLREMTLYLRLCGIIVIFLPAYSPMYNPCEFAINLIRNHFKKLNSDGKRTDTKRYLLRSILEYQKFDFSKVFKHCGYSFSKFFPTNFDALVEKYEKQDKN
jgi:transposase